MKQTSESDESTSSDNQDLLRYAHKVEVLGRMLDGIAHDLNNALTVMVMNLEVLDADSAMAEKHRRRLELMNDAVIKSTKQVRRLLAFSRKIPIEVEALSLSDVIADLADLFEHALGDQISLQITPNLANAQVRMDRAQLDLCLLTLLMNARAAMPTGGGVRIDIEKGAHGVATGTIGANGEVAIVIRCSPRIGEEQPEFSDPTSSEDRFGLGAVRETIEQTGGRLVVEGSRIDIYLPAFTQDFDL